MNYAQIRSMDISNGEGVGVALFVSGCPFHCEGCFNSEAWDYEYGHEFTPDTMEMLARLLEKPYVQRISILGGEPLADKNIDTVGRIILTLKIVMPDKKIWLYSGFRYEDLNLYQRRIVSGVDVFVDGPFVEAEKDLRLKFRGSRNQRVIDIKEMRDNLYFDDVIIRKGYED